MLKEMMTEPLQPNTPDSNASVPDGANPSADSTNAIPQDAEVAQTEGNGLSHSPLSDDLGQIQDSDLLEPSGANQEAEAPETTPSPVDQWKCGLRQDFEQWLAAVDEIPDIEPETLAELDSPDLYSFYEALTVFTAEFRKSNRRTAEALSQWGEILQRFENDLDRLREHINRIADANAKDQVLPRQYCLVLIELTDRMYRLEAAFNSPPKPSWWDDDERMRKAWATQQQGFAILVSHVEEMLKRAGVSRLEVIGKPFDPAFMMAVAAEPDPNKPHHTVIEEIAAGYRHYGELLRAAQVKVSINKNNS